MPPSLSLEEVREIVHTLLPTFEIYIVHLEVLKEYSIVGMSGDEMFSASVPCPASREDVLRARVFT